MPWGAKHIKNREEKKTSKYLKKKENTEKLHEYYKY